MRLGKRRVRRILLVLGFCLAGGLGLWLLLPLWFPWLLRPIAHRVGVDYTNYTRQGYGGFLLRGAEFKTGAIRVRADRVEVCVPSVWAWRHTTGTSASQRYVVINDWRFDSFPTGNTNAGGDSVFQVFGQVDPILAALKNWLPTAALTNGTMHIQDTILNVPVATWTNGVFQGQVAFPQLGQKATVRVNVGAPYDIQIGSVEQRLQLAIRVSKNSSTVNAEGTGTWWTNPISLAVQFSREGVLPSKATLQATNVHLPASLARLDENQYRELAGSFAGTWTDGQFTADLQAQAIPPSGQTNWPLAHLELHVQGDTNSAKIKSAAISSPWLQAELSRELQVHFTGEIVREPAALKFTADLTRQPWLPLHGRLKGEAQLTPAGRKYPSARFQLSGAEIGLTQLTAQAFAAEGALNWPVLEIASATARFEDSSAASAGGKLDLEKLVLAGGRFAGSGPMANRWLPAGYSYESLAIAGSFEGPITNLNHQGHLDVTNFSTPRFQPLQLGSDWTGIGMKIQRATATVDGTNASLSAEGAVEISEAKSAFLLNRLTMNLHTKPVLELEKPAQFSLSREPAGGWLAEMTSFHWAGSGGDIEIQAAVDWPRAGNIRTSIKNVRSESLAEFWPTASSEQFEIHSLQTSAQWSNGPVTARVELSAAGTPAPPGSPRLASQTDTNQAALLSSPLLVELKLSSDARGFSVSNLVVSTQTSAVMVVQGTLPVILQPASTNILQINAGSPLQLSLASQPHAFFWDKVRAWTGLNLTDPRINVDVSGTWRQPQGTVVLAAQVIEYQSRATHLPKVQDFLLSVQIDRQLAHLNDCRLLVQGQPMSITGDLPLGDRFWRGLGEGRLPDWEQGNLRVRIDHAELSALQSLLPDVVAPQGFLKLDLSILPGANLEGELSIQGARTQPLVSGSPFRDIDLAVNFRGRKLTLEATAALSGAGLNLSGTADLSGRQWWSGTVPPFQVALRGTNVPLSRQPGSIVRSDLDLKIIKTNDAATLITGEARLHDSFYLSDLGDLVPGKVATVSQRPPYFSLDVEPLAEWRLAVHVTGERFLKVRTTLFNGEVSANLDLRGTLNDPIALGDVKIDSGTVRFPFGSLSMRQGYITLTSQDPYRPQLAISAAAKDYGYDVKMDVTGPADAPVLQFSSTPPLSSEQIVLLLTAGQIPRQAQGMSTQQRAESAAVFLGRDLLGRLGFGDSGGGRLTIRSGEQISEAGKPTYNVEYRLSDRWYLVGEYDRFNDFNAGFKWRIYSK